MRSYWLGYGFAWAALCVAAASCGSELKTSCGPGTELIARQCVPIEDAAVNDAAGQTVGQSTQATEASPGGCGEHAILVNGVCQGLQPIGGACERGGQCDSQTCLPESDGFPGGYCSIPMCNDRRPCTPGSHCVYSEKRDRHVCLTFCSGASECRPGYVCQPLYEGDISVCTPACTTTDNCPDQTSCDAASGKCVLRECDPNESSDACGAQRLCYPDPRNITTRGGICLSTCDPARPSCGGQDVCQPLPEDPQHKGVCAPPVCTKTSDCQVGSVCTNSVCQPPPRCDDKGKCADASTACAGGPGGQCMPRCKDDAACKSLQSELLCVEGVASERVCLPLGSYPGSACRADKNRACDMVKAGSMMAQMNCQNDKCVVDCGGGGDALCKAISPSLHCASGVLDGAVCLPSGSYPGGPCAGANADQCAEADLGGGKRAKMLCKGGQCLLDCGADAVRTVSPEAYCTSVANDLTCASTAYPGSAVCLPQGSYPGGPCSHGSCSKLGDRSMSCQDDVCLVNCTPDNPSTRPNEDDCGAIDDSLVCARGVYAQDVCVPRGSFPGSKCGPNNQCAQDLKGIAELDMQCVNGSCAIGCNESGKWAGYGESLCSLADPALTCAQSANNVCVKACREGQCDAGFSCLEPGMPPQKENACLPNGSFPGAPCGPNNSCGSGPGGARMTCRNNVCLVSCPAGSSGDELCSMLSGSLTCADAGGNVCVPACNAGSCPSGLSCLAYENACLPNGTFPGAACASGNRCNGSPMLACVPGQNRCAPGCNIDEGQDNANSYCSMVGSQLGAAFNNCADVGGGLHVCIQR